MFLNCTASSDDRLWLRLDARFFGLQKHLFICFAYISPEKSCHIASRDNLWIILQQEVAQFSLEGNVMLTGDFNARTGQLQDFIINDSDDHLPLPPDYVTDYCDLRTSKDKTCNPYGQELLHICKNAQLRILNGRIGNDRDKGDFTCVTPRGNSVVDYTIVSQDLLNQIYNFKIGDITTLSDHCEIVTSIECNNYSMFQLRNISMTSQDLINDIVERYKEFGNHTEVNRHIPKIYSWSQQVCWMGRPLNVKT